MRTWGNYSFEWAALIRPEVDDLGAPQAFYPHSAYANPQNLALHPYGEGPFCRFRIPTNLQAAGVYLLVSDTPLYAGECANLATRFNHGYGAISPRDCYTGGRPNHCRINHLLFEQAKAGKQTEIWFHKATKRAAVLEEVIKAVKPAWNS